MLFVTTVQSEETYLFTGIHYMASFQECDHDALCTLDQLKQVMMEACIKSGATILSYNDHVFPPDGYTLVILLSESHASIHTYPECNACYVDLFTCGTRCDAAKFERVLKSYLNPKVVNEDVFVR
jgi:S-adenosylmethionine decarboxylase proenzyme